MNYDVVALGEYLIDFTPYGRSEAGQPLFERNPGGAPVNVVAAFGEARQENGFHREGGQRPVRCVFTRSFARCGRVR